MKRNIVTFLILILFSVCTCVCVVLVSLFRSVPCMFLCKFLCGCVLFLLYLFYSCYNEFFFLFPLFIGINSNSLLFL